MKIMIGIKCDNAAFDDSDCGRELGRILRHFAEAMEDTSKQEIYKQHHGSRCRDLNGNFVAVVTVIDPPTDVTDNDQKLLNDLLN